MDIKKILLHNPITAFIKSFLSKIKVPFLKGLNFWDVFSIYLVGLIKGSLSNRAAAISWRLFMGLFPFTIMFLILLQYLPHYNEAEEYFHNIVLKAMIPPDMFQYVSDYISIRFKNMAEGPQNHNFQLVSIAFLVYVYVSTMGVLSLINGMVSHNSYELRERNGVKNFIVAFLLTLFFTIVNLLGLLFIYYTEVVWDLLVNQSHFIQKYLEYVSGWVPYVAFLFLVFFILCVLYYYGPKNQLRFKEVMPGALFTTFLFVLIGYFFGVYLSSLIGKYNLLYGSIGSILLVMITLYFYVMLVLAGYELNIAIKRAKTENRKVENSIHET